MFSFASEKGFFQLVLRPAVTVCLSYPIVVKEIIFIRISRFVTDNLKFHSILIRRWIFVESFSVACSPNVFLRGAHNRHFDAVVDTNLLRLLSQRRCECFSRRNIDNCRHFEYVTASLRRQRHCRTLERVDLFRRRQQVAVPRRRPAVAAVGRGLDSVVVVVLGPEVAVTSGSKILTRVIRSFAFLLQSVKNVVITLLIKHFFNDFAQLYKCTPHTGFPLYSRGFVYEKFESANTKTAILD